MRVAELWRYPVKSLQGEQLDGAAVGDGGIVGDRGYAIFDLGTGFGLTARRVPELLFASARIVGEGRPPEITLPDGTIACGDAALSHWLGRRVALRAAAQVDERQYENPMDAERDADWIAFDGAPGRSTTRPARGCRWCRPGRWGSGTAAGSAPTCCSTARARTGGSAPRSPSATCGSTS